MKQHRPLISKVFNAGAVFAVLIFTGGLATAHDLVWPGEKLKALFPQAVSFEQKNLYVSDDQKAAIEKTLGNRLPEEDLKPSVYFAIVKPNENAPPRKAAVIIFIDAPGENRKIEMGVVVSGKGELMKVQLFENREPKALSRTDFLSQFEGKKASDKFKIGSDVRAPHGNENSAQAIASGARRGLIIINELFRRQ